MSILQEEPPRKEPAPPAQVQAALTLHPPSHLGGEVGEEGHRPTGTPWEEPRRNGINVSLDRLIINNERERNNDSLTLSPPSLKMTAVELEAASNALIEEKNR